MRVLMFCGVNTGRTVRSTEIASACNASGNHLAQVIQQLHSHGFVQTLRGRAGGLRLSRDARLVLIGQVFRIFEAGLPFAECFSAEGNTCPLTGACRLRNVLARAVEAFYHELDMVTLEDLVRGNCDLSALLSLPEAAQQICAQG
jgi:Rrf2 family nitric oxide-sensitive transcriptional repressor